MGLLLDTQILVWVISGDRRLSGSASRAIAAESQELFVSAVTACEFVDLEQRGRFPPIVTFDRVLGKLAASMINFPAEAWQILARLPDLHRDPVDRMLIAHAIHADLTLITADETMRRYPVRSIW